MQPKNVAISFCVKECAAFNPNFLFILIFFVWIFLRSIELEADQISLMSCSCNKMDEKHSFLPKWWIKKRGNGHVLPQKNIFLECHKLWKYFFFFGDFTKNHPSVLSVVVCFVMGVCFGSKDWQTWTMHSTAKRLNKRTNLFN